MRHKDRIPDLLEWKRLPDHFYFTKFFDPYIKREFEVIRTANVNNSEQFEIQSWSIFLFVADRFTQSPLLSKTY